ncbi:hypothetical protein TNCV_984451 [Trichonephila clavipes]|nr:hypothetical protein TNCV_984451 [Trichonephila clavipes]
MLKLCAVLPPDANEPTDQVEEDENEGKEDEINCKDIPANYLIAENEELDFDRVNDLEPLETIGLNPNKEVYLSDKDRYTSNFFKLFEQNTTYTKRNI